MFGKDNFLSQFAVYLILIVHFFKVGFAQIRIHIFDLRFRIDSVACKVDHFLIDIGGKDFEVNIRVVGFEQLVNQDRDRISFFAR